MAKCKLLVLIFLMIPFFSKAQLFKRDPAKQANKEQQKIVKKSHKGYNYSGGGHVRWDPEKKEYVSEDPEWKKAPEQQKYDPKEFAKPKMKKRIRKGKGKAKKGGSGKEKEQDSVKPGKSPDTKSPE
jgi:hypothetical protein